jgi:archaellum biogenesis ATPase FlaH
MVQDELVQRSSVKALEELMDGGLSMGEAGVIMSPSGLGKTSVLVQIALYKLLQGKKVVHVSFTQQTSYVLSWYDNIFSELIKNKNVVSPQELMDGLVKNRVIINFNQDGVTSDTIRASLGALVNEGGFKAQSIIIDGFDFSKANEERIRKLKLFAGEVGLSLWYSCATKDSCPFADDFNVILKLDPQTDYIGLRVLKNREKAIDRNQVLKLDPRTLLLLGE